jgi:hypothetical protein
MFSVMYVLREGAQAKELTASHEQLRFALTDTRREIQLLAAKVDAISAVQPATPARPEPTLPAPSSRGSVRRRPVVKGSPVVRTSLEEKRWKQVQSQLAAQHDQIAKTQEDLHRTGEDLEGKLNTARDQLNGSIAKTHEDVVALQKRGERNYYEFQIARSKQFQRVGPLGLSLRKTDTKHRRYDLAMMVNDDGLEKKQVNIYEPIWINLSDRPQPVELVVNRVDKDQIRGYVSEPKYKSAELGSAPAPSTPTGLKQR